MKKDMKSTVELYIGEGDGEHGTWHLDSITVAHSSFLSDDEIGQLAVDKMKEKLNKEFSMLGETGPGYAFVGVYSINRGEE